MLIRLSGQWDPHPVKRQFHGGRQAGIGFLVIQVMGYVGKESSLRLQFLRHRNSLLQAEVSRVRAMSQRIKDQDIQPLQQSHAFGGNLVGIRTVSHVTKAKTQHLKIGSVL